MNNPNSHEEFTQMHDQYFTEWADAMKTENTAELEKAMADNYYVTFFTRDKPGPVFFERSEAIEGMRHSISSHHQSDKNFANRIIRLRNAENAVVFYEQIIGKNSDESARLFTIEDWHKNHGQWEIVREIQEHV